MEWKWKVFHECLFCLENESSFNFHLFRKKFYLGTRLMRFIINKPSQLFCQNFDNSSYQTLKNVTLIDLRYATFELMKQTHQLIHDFLQNIKWVSVWLHRTFFFSIFPIESPHVVWCYFYASRCVFGDARFNSVSIYVQLRHIVIGPFTLLFDISLKMQHEV